MHCQSKPYLSWKVHGGSLHVEDATGDKRWNTDISNDAAMKTLTLTLSSGHRNSQEGKTGFLGYTKNIFLTTKIYFLHFLNSDS